MKRIHWFIITDVNGFRGNFDHVAMAENSRFKPVLHTQAPVFHTKTNTKLSFLSLQEHFFFAKKKEKREE